MKYNLHHFINEKFVEVMTSEECCEIGDYLSEIKFAFDKLGGMMPVICTRPNLVEFEQFIETGAHTMDQSNMVMDYVVHDSINYNYFLAKVVHMKDDSFYLVFAPKDSDYRYAAKNKFNRIRINKPEKFRHNGLFDAISSLVYSGAIVDGDTFAIVEDPTSLSRIPSGALIETFTIIKTDEIYRYNDDSLKKHLIERIASVVD